MLVSYLQRLVATAARRPRLTVAIVLAAALGGGLLALGLKPSAGSDTFVSRSSASYQATNDDHQRFGGDPVVVLVREPLTNLVETQDLGVVTQLEACLAGQVVVKNSQLQAFTPSPHATPYGGWSSPCGKLSKARYVQVVYGPGTFLNRAVAAVRTEVQTLFSGAQQSVTTAERDAYQLALQRHLSKQQALASAKAAGQLEYQKQYTQLIQTYLQSGISGLPSIDDKQFIPQIVFDQTRGVNQPKARFSYLFPTANSALIQVRLRANLTDTQQAQAISWIRQAVKMPMFRTNFGATYTVTGAPVVVDDLAAKITGSIGLLLLGALAVMAVTLLIVFRSRMRLLPLAVALAAAGITFGVVALVGASLTMASIAVLPILIGLAVDYAIQFQSRAEEARGIHDGDRTAAAAVVSAARTGAPTIAIAALATATGFLVLLLSPVPMVRGFGLLLVVGIGVALLCALTAGSAALVLADRAGADGVLGASLRGAADILHDAKRAAAAPLRRLRAPGLQLGRLRAPGPRRPNRPQRARAGILGFVLRRPAWVLGAAFALAVLGWVADTQTSVQSDVTKLVPPTMPALQDLRTLEKVTGVSGEIDVTVRSADVTNLKTIEWMSGYEQSLLSHYGYKETKGCAQATLCPALSLPDLFLGGGGSGQSQNSQLTQASVRGLLAAVPPYFSQAVITPDHREAVLAFGIRLMPLARQQRVIDYMRSQLHPPSGVTVRLAGLPVLAAQANAALSSSPRRLLTLLAGLVAVALVLLAVFRNVRRALVPIVPIVLATGWSALILFATRIPLNPMSATLGALVIAISTEFSVLLSERFRQERRAGYELTEALSRTYRSTGHAVLASGLTAIMGFAVLILSDITMLRDFGFVTLIDLSVSLGGVLLVLPAVLVLSERRGAIESVGGLVGAAGRRFRGRGGARESRERALRARHEPLQHRLDPEAAAAGRAPGAGQVAAGAHKPARTEDEQVASRPAVGDARPEHVRQPVIDTRPYRWMIGVFGLLLVLVISVYQFAAHGVGTVGVPIGKQLRGFAAPLANSTLRGDANLSPPCTLTKHDRRALNVCLILKRQPLVLTLFVPSSSDCTREVDALQTVSRRFHASGVAFAAVAVRGSRGQTASLIRSHRWTIPVAYDRDGAVGVAYGVETCPMVELARRGGIVADRLIGNHWLAPAALAARVQALANHPR